MRVIKVALKRIKSYDDKTTIHLDDGVTAILGENGAGKSTIAQAIGFALFDHLDVTHEEFVREGENSGTAWVTFENEAGETYTVRRHAGRSGYSVTAEDAGTELEHDTTSEVIDWLEDQFGIGGEGSVDLSTLWRRCIGVPQTKFLSDFADNTAPRKNHFDPLLGIDVYERAWGSGSGTTLKDPVDDLKSSKQTATNRITTLEDRVSGINQKRKEVENLESNVGDYEDVLWEVRDVLGASLAEYYELHELKERRDEKEAELDEQMETVDERREAVEDAREAFADAELAQDVVDETEAGHEAYEEAENELSRLRNRRKSRGALKNDISDQRTTYQRARSNYDQVSDDASTAREAKETIEATEEPAQRYEEIDEEIQNAGDQEDRLKQINNRLEEIEEDDLPEAREERKAQQKAVDHLEAKQRTAGKVDSLEPRERNLSQQLQRQVSGYDDLVEQRRTLRSLGNDDAAVDDAAGDGAASHNHSGPEAEATCPTCNRPLDDDQRASVLDDVETKIKQTVDSIHETAREHRNLQEELATAKAARRDIQGLDAERKILREHEQTVRNLEQEQEELKDDRGEVAERVAELDNRRQERTSLEDDHAAHRDATVTYKNNEAALEKEDEKLLAMVDEAHELANLERDLRTFEGLDEQIERQEQVKDDNEDDHLRYQTQIDIANELENRRESLIQQYEAVAQPERDRRALEAKIADLKTEFDQNRYDELDREISTLKQRRAEKKTHLRKEREQYREATDELERLERTDEQLQRWKETHVQLERDIAFAESVRQGVRDAGPKMRELLASRIGERANAIYQTLRGTGRESLTWDATYQITVQDGTQQKSFTNLSGGEKMAAALSVRLATMERISPVGLAVLDEPTANLDADKKGNLVTELERLDVFDQLLVVSHDDTFSGMTEYTVQLDKPDRSTRVVADARGERRDTTRDDKETSPQEAE